MPCWPTTPPAGPTAPKLFDRGYVPLETACLLFSSFTCGLMALAIERRSPLPTYLWAGVTFLLGAAFLGLEISEFARMIAEGAAPTRSAFLSAFFTLVGTHGLHVTARPRLAGRDDGAGRHARLPADRGAPAALLRRCSGTPSTSSGSASSPSSTWERTDGRLSPHRPPPTARASRRESSAASAAAC